MQGIDRFIRVLQSRHIHKAKSSRLTSMRVHHNYCFAHLYSMSSELVQDALCSTINEIYITETHLAVTIKKISQVVLSYSKR